MNTRTRLRLIFVPGAAVLLMAAMSAENVRNRQTTDARAIAGVELAQAPQKPAEQKTPAKPDPKKAAPAKDSPAGQAATPDQAREQDEKTIRANVDALAKAFNAKDVNALAQFFTADAEIVDEDGNTVQGRDDIKQSFADTFKEHPESNLKVAIGSIRFVSPSVAIEDGTSTVHREKDIPVEHSKYTVVHVKQNGKWLTASARDYPDDKADGIEELAELEWMVGDWVDESAESLTMTTYRWDEHHLYLLGEFNLQVTGHISLSGQVRIGWDPLAKKLHSWVFDSKGGFSEGLWTRDGNQWVVKMTGVTSDGQAASATHVNTFLSKGRMTWESHDRVVGDDAKPDIEKIVIVRKPPSSQ